MNIEIGTDNTAFQKANSENVIASTDQVDLSFDWLPAMQDGCVVFKVRISRGESRSAIDFTVDLHRFAQAELEQLQASLVRRHAGLTSSYEVVRFVVWLLERSLAQQQPQLGEAGRCTEVRKFLLSNPAESVYRRYEERIIVWLLSLFIAATRHTYPRDVRKPLFSRYE